MSKVRSVIKESLPGLFYSYKHILRIRTISEINKRKKMTDLEQKALLSTLYRKRIGHPLDWSNINAYTEKMQYVKLHDMDPLKTAYSDKYKVRDWIEKEIGKDYLVPILGAWSCFDAIAFNDLPNRFVLKTNHGSGTNVVVIDKSKINYKRIKCFFDDWMKMDFGYKTMELHYSGIERLIIAEEFIEAQNNDLQDYKFLCFDGTPYFCWVDKGRYSKHTRDIYDLSWQLQPWIQGGIPNSIEGNYKPKNFEQMIEIAKTLSRPFSHVRVDLYNVDGKIYFGEMTFTNGGGLDKIEPEQYDFELGKLWRIN